MKINLVSESCFREKICPQCGKKFLCYQETWVYKRYIPKINTGFFCSYHCTREFDKIREGRKTKRGRVKSAK